MFEEVFLFGFEIGLLFVYFRLRGFLLWGREEAREDVVVGGWFRLRLGGGGVEAQEVGGPVGGLAGFRLTVGGGTPA